MARGPKRTIEIQIAEIDAKIAKKENEMKALRAQRAGLEGSRQQELAAKVVKLATEKGVSIEELLTGLERK